MDLRLVLGVVRPETPDGRDVGSGTDVEGDREDPAADRREGHRGPAALVGPEEGGPQGRLEALPLLPEALVGAHGVDHALEGQVARRW